MMSHPEVSAWLAHLPSTSFIGVDGGGLTLVELRNGHPAAHLEVGGYDDPDTIDVPADPAPTPSPALPARDTSRVLDFSTWSKALENPEALRMCFEAIGYARGHCDAEGVGSGDAIDFGRAYAVLVAARQSRPSIQHAWKNWRAGWPIAAFPQPRQELSASAQTVA
ncbi:hypothetical protein ACW9HR_37195 [Nocardia gipuzkoensis]